MFKKIYVKYLVTGEEKELIVETTEKILKIKQKIEKMFEIKISNKLMIKHKHKRNQTSLNDENLTVKEAHIKDNDIITIGKTDVFGGKYFYIDYLSIKIIFI